MRDCQAELSADDLKLISCGPKTIEFGEVSVRSALQKCFSVCNHLPHTIRVALKVMPVP